MKISIITPTYERERFLKGTYQLIQSQTHCNWEWLICDTSLRPFHFSDSRVIYLHDHGILSIGEKRNRLKEKATGDLIVHFDDDDYYAPIYLETIVKQLEKAAFFTLDAWFSFDSKTGQFYYWDTQALGEVRYSVNPVSGTRIYEIDLGPQLAHQKEDLNQKGRKGYGFSFAYTKEVAKECFFPDIDLAEDRYFFEDVEKVGTFPIITKADEQGLAVHVIHDTNTSGEFPQYRIPLFLVKERFSKFFPYMTALHENRPFDWG